MSKTLIVLMVGMLAIGCESTPKELTLREKVVGTYRFQRVSLVFLEDGIAEQYRHNDSPPKTNSKGKLLQADKELEGKWKITKEGELHGAQMTLHLLSRWGLDKDGDIGVFRINPDDSITFIAVILKDGKRIDLPKDKQDTAKKIK